MSVSLKKQAAFERYLDKLEIQRTEAVMKGLCSDCMTAPARPDRLTCGPCTKAKLARLEAQRRAKGAKARTVRCGICSALGHDRRTHDLHVASRT